MIYSRPASPSGRRHPEVALEGAAKRGLGFVAGPLRDRFQRLTRRSQKVCRDLKAPSREVVNRG
jgi:hypothetical protein